jgi:DNA-binding response OmpR family regulator
MARILIVDDDPDIVEVTRLCLEKEGHHVMCAYCREDGMRLAAEGCIDLLILDVMMTEPDDGITMVQELRKIGFASPILMMSSISRVTGLAYGRDEAVMPVDDFVEKPVSPAVLIAKVNTLMKR